MNEEKRKFYIVSTPIGNLEDITVRAIRILKEVDEILCEDTRVSKKLLSFYKINTKLTSYHSHSSEQKEKEIVKNILQGKKYALISDAGTPTISDPGAKLIRYIRDNFSNQISLIPVPGPSALITALSVSGFYGSSFCFYGFLPRKKGRKQKIKEALYSRKISVFYESPHRILSLLYSFREIAKEEKIDISSRKVLLAREMTKIFEEFREGDIEEIISLFESKKIPQRGEFVLVLDSL